MPNSLNFDQLLVVSNRLPVRIERTKRGMRVRSSSGGLVTAMDPALRARGGRWIGWLGAPGPAPDLDLGYPLDTVELSASEVRRYYQGFANASLDNPWRVALMHAVEHGASAMVERAGAHGRSASRNRRRFSSPFRYQNRSSWKWFSVSKCEGYP